MKNRNAKIIAAVEESGFLISYHLIGEEFGVSRNVVAGVMFRHRHPYKTRVASPSGKRNKIGTGQRQPPYQPRYTAQNSR